jgi:hypothetical protein
MEGMRPHTAPFAGERMSGLKLAQAAVALLVVTAAEAQAPALPGYTLTLISPPAGASAIVPTAINSTGEVTGSIVYAPGQAAHAFIWTFGPPVALMDIGTLPYPGSATYGSATGMSFTDRGVVGTVVDPGTPPMWSFGFSYGSQGLSPLSNLTGFPFCTATGINTQSSSNALIVGSCNNTQETIGVIYVNSQAQQFGSSGISANAVNDFGQIAASGMPAFLYATPADTITKIPLLSGGNSSTQASASSVNNAGQAVGWQQTSSGTYESFYYDNGSTTALAGVPTSTIQPGLSINNAGQIVGYTATAAAPTPAPFLFAHGLSTNLNTLISGTDPNKRFVTLTNAYAINDAGQIVATGTDSRSPGVTGAYVLSPTSPVTASVNLQASVSTVVAGTPFTLYWTAQGLTGCTASGGSGKDGWSGTVSFTGGQQQLTETAAQSDPYNFTLTCTQSNGGFVDSEASVTVTAKPAPPHDSGGGAVDPLLLVALAALTVLRRDRAPRAPT